MIDPIEETGERAYRKIKEAIDLYDDLQAAYYRGLEENQRRDEVERLSQETARALHNTLRVLLDRFYQLHNELAEGRRERDRLRAELSACGGLSTTDSAKNNTYG